ncbi:MAG: SDR family oxidoreductase [Pseudomonadota bacterium]
MSIDVSAMLSLQGRTALVTGASSGLGEHFARVLAAAGARVAVGARRVERLDALVEELVAAGGEALAVPLDVSDAGSVTTALATIEAHFGVADVLINNAGVADSRYCLKVDEASWDYIMDTNLKAVWRLARDVAARCIAADKPGAIVNIASILGLRVSFGESTYAVSKAAVVQMTKAMALELARKNIRINALCPGYFATELNTGYLQSDQGQDMLSKTPAGRAGQLNELSAPLLLLASGAGSFINGATLAVDGGHLVSSL